MQRMDTSKASEASGIDLPVTLGALNPVGSVVMALPGGDEGARRAMAALEAAGYAKADIELIEAERMQRWLEQQAQDTSAVAAFGAEAAFMQRYLPLAQDGCGWLIIKADDDDVRDRVVAVAQAHKARIAIKYNRLAHEELPVEPGLEPAARQGVA
jgi:hypothetical protein